MPTPLLDAVSLWYSVLIKAVDDRWTAVLSRPGRSLRSFEHRVAMASRGLLPVFAAASTVCVVENPASCGSDAPAALDSSILVRVAPGAPVVQTSPRTCRSASSPDRARGTSDRPPS